MQTLLSWLMSNGFKKKRKKRKEEKSLNVTNCTRILQSHSESWTDLKWNSKTSSMAFATSLLEYSYFTGKCLMKSQKNLSIVYPGLEETYQLTYYQKCPNLTTQTVHSNKYNRTGGQNNNYCYPQDKLIQSHAWISLYC